METTYKVKTTHPKVELDTTEVDELWEAEKAAMDQEAALMPLTEKEHKALTALVLDGMKVIGAEEPVDLLEDNMTWFNRKSLSEGTGFSKHEAAGLMGSLEKKGLIMLDEDPDQEYACTVTEEGILWAQAAFKAVEKAIIKETFDRR
jgi:hypothetical protein